MENRKFGKILNDCLVYAQTTIMCNDTIIVNPDDEQYRECGYKKVVDDGKVGDIITYAEDDATITVCHELSLSNAKISKIAQITEYDDSTAVNEFIINGIGMWLDGDTQRPKLRGAVQTYLDKGLGDYPLCVEGVGVIPVAPTKLLSMLADIEVYAIECFTKTFEHKEAVNTLTTCEEIVNYDFTTGYPEKLVFNL